MSTITFDTFEFNKTLREADYVSRVELKIDVNNLRKDMQVMEQGIRKDMQTLEERITATIYKAILWQTFAIAGFMAGLLAIAVKLFLPS